MYLGAVLLSAPYCLHSLLNAVHMPPLLHLASCAPGCVLALIETAWLVLDDVRNVQDAAKLVADQEPAPRLACRGFRTTSQKFEGYCPARIRLKSFYTCKHSLSLLNLQATRRRDIASARWISRSLTRRSGSLVALQLTVLARDSQSAGMLICHCLSLPQL